MWERIRALLYRIAFPFVKISLKATKTRRDGALVVVSRDDTILLVRNTYGLRQWTFPGGGLKSHESPKEAARREVHEEVGLVLENLVFLDIFRGELGEVSFFTTASFQGELALDRSEILEAQWFRVEEVKEKRLSQIGRIAFKAFRNYKLNETKRTSI